jgi:hypothetical protein
MPEVMAINPTFVLKHTILREIVQNTYGDGYEQQMTSEVASSRPDGSGSSTSHKGVHLFTVNWRGLSKTNANTLWSFFLARLNLINEAFYFYNPEEHAIDPTGVETTGRYLVQLRDPNQALSREHFRSCIWGFNGIDFIEVKS